MHEASLHEHSSFVTLTYSDENLPWDGSVHVTDLQRFMKRLRKRLGSRVRYFACGEYGERLWRPHYHLILFGYSFPDREPWRRTGSGHVTYRSELLERAWPLGHCEVGDVTPQSAGYVARYCLKKVGGDAAESHYSRPHPVTGEIHSVRPEFICMSSKPGIGSDWYEKFGDDAFPSDFLIIDGRKVPVPAYYLKKLKAEDEAAALQVVAERKAEGQKRASDSTDARLLVRQDVQRLKVERLHREME